MEPGGNEGNRNMAKTAIITNRQCVTQCASLRPTIRRSKKNTAAKKFDSQNNDDTIVPNYEMGQRFSTCCVWCSCLILFLFSFSSYFTTNIFILVARVCLHRLISYFG